MLTRRDLSNALSELNDVQLNELIDVLSVLIDVVLIDVVLFMLFLIRFVLFQPPPPPPLQLLSPNLCA